MIWVSEIGSNHGGSKALAYELIRQSKLAGATIAKFQFGHTAEAQAKYTDGYNPIRYVDDWAQDLKKWCDSFDIELMASIWSMAGLEAARSVGMKRYKIAHQSHDSKLMRAILSDGKPTFVSVDYDDLSFMDEYEDDNIVWVQTTKEYPTYHRKAIAYGPLGYSSHMFGIADALIAVARGANYIEKHICLHNYAGFPKDAAFSLTPTEFADMVKYGNEIARLR